MSRTKFLGLIVGGLLLSNLLLVAFILLRPQREKHREPREVIIKKLHFDDQQQEQYGELISWHRRHINEQDRKILQLKKRLYQSLTNPEGAVLNDSLIQELGQAQMEVERIHYQHFEDIRKLCRPEQLKYYESLAEDIAGLFAPPPPKRKHP